MKEKKTKLSNEDAFRIARLYEEAAGKLYEASLILARNLGYKASPQGFRLINNMADTTHQVEAQDVKKGESKRSRKVVVLGKRIYFYTDAGCGYYDVEEGICASAPCH